MIKVDLNKPLKSPFDNEDIGKETLGRQLASSLISAPGEKEKSMKFLDWAIKLWANKPLELDKVDFNKLKNFIEESRSMTVLVHAQLMESINKIKIPEEK